MRIIFWWRRLSLTIRYLILGLFIGFVLCLLLWLPFKLFLYTDYTGMDTKLLVGLLIGVISGVSGMTISKHINKIDD